MFERLRGQRGERGESPLPRVELSGTSLRVWAPNYPTDPGNPSEKRMARAEGASAPPEPSGAIAVSAARASRARRIAAFANPANPRQTHRRFPVSRPSLAHDTPAFQPNPPKGRSSSGTRRVLPPSEHEQRNQDGADADRRHPVAAQERHDGAERRDASHDEHDATEERTDDVAAHRTSLPAPEVTKTHPGANAYDERGI